jgi:hypothetical protein
VSAFLPTFMWVAPRIIPPHVTRSNTATSRDDRMRRRFVCLQPDAVCLFVTPLRLRTFSVQGYHCASVKKAWHGLLPACTVGTRDLLVPTHAYNVRTIRCFLWTPLFLFSCSYREASRCNVPQINALLDTFARPCFKIHKNALF